MKKWRNAIMVVMCLVTALTTSVSAAYYESVPLNMPNAGNTDTQSVNREFTLDFEESTAWYTAGFSNSALGFNHNNVSLTYDAYTASDDVNDNAVSVKVDLYVDSDGDGDYERYATDGSYVQSLMLGGTVQYRLPYGREEYNYRLKITNSNSKVTSGTFTMKSFYNSVA